MTILKNFFDDKLPDRFEFFSSLKMNALVKRLFACYWCLDYV